MVVAQSGHEHHRPAAGRARPRAPRSARAP
jgi:hypothetical protein